MRKVDVYVDDKGQPQHLAVLNEHHLDESKHRALCGSPVGSMEVRSLQPGDVKIGCADCNAQFKMWKEVNELS